MTDSPTLSMRTVVIEPRRGGFSLGLREIREYRDLLYFFYFFAWRDIRIRYKQSALGASRAFLQPLMATLVFSIFFGRWR
jgi:lipopolysaccharide transport system permease protein